MTSASALNPLFEALLSLEDPSISDIVGLLKIIDSHALKAHAALTAKEERLFKSHCDEIASAVLRLQHDYTKDIAQYKLTKPERFPLLLQLLEAIFEQVIALNLQTDVTAHQSGHKLAFLSQFGDIKTNTSYNQYGSYQLTRQF